MHLQILLKFSHRIALRHSEQQTRLGAINYLLWFAEDYLVALVINLLHFVIELDATPASQPCSNFSYRVMAVSSGLNTVFEEFILTHFCNGLFGACQNFLELESLIEFTMDYNAFDS